MMRRRRPSQKLRAEAFERDGGICAVCAADCEKIKRVYWSILDFDAQCFYGELLASNGHIFWEADHVIEVAANGSDSPRNIQTLCVKCHKAKTAEFRALVVTVELLPCAAQCDDPDHVEYLLTVLRERYDVEYFVADNGQRFTLNIAAGTKPDYMARAYSSVAAHRDSILGVVLEHYNSVPIEGSVC